MIRINAVSIITRMANEKAFWNWALKNFIGRSRSAVVFSFKNKPASNFVAPKRTAPVPTVICFFNVIKKSFEVFWTHIYSPSNAILGVN